MTKKFLSKVFRNVKREVVGTKTISLDSILSNAISMYATSKGIFSKNSLQLSLK